MEQVVAITRALSDPNRVRVLMMLDQGELCVCQIIEVLGLAPSTVSKHMAILRQAGLVSSRKEGRWIHFSLAGRDAAKPIRDILNWTRTGLAEDATVAADHKKLNKTLKIDRESLCQRMKK